MLLDAQQLGRILLVGPLAYLLVIVLLRASGKRTLSKMNAFDFIVTIALGSMLATIILDDDISLLEGGVALTVLILGQLVITFLSSRSKTFMSLVKAQPTLIYHRGNYLEDVLERERVAQEEVLAAARRAGHQSLSTVDAVVLESDGTFSVLTANHDSLQIPNVDSEGFDD
ncbi:MAG: YetF domain-containing protein [Trueperaceae bacterium]